MRVWGGGGLGRGRLSASALPPPPRLRDTMSAWRLWAAALLLQVSAAGRDGDPGGRRGYGEGVWGWK